MTALTEARETARRAGVLWSDPVAATTTIWKGGVVALNAAGNAVPGGATNTLKVRGIARTTVKNAGSAGDALVESESGPARLANSADADLITRAEIGADCYLVDDQTVAKTNGGSTRPVAGKVVDVDNAGVWVRLGI